MRLSLSKNDYAPILLVLITGILFYFNASLHDILNYDREQILAGQWWRLISGNFLHSNLYHWLLNGAGVLMLMFLHNKHYGHLRYSLLTLVSCLGCGLGLLLFSPQMSDYVGLSGALHGMFVWGAIKDIEKKWFSGYLLLLGVAVKLAWEQVYGADPDLANLIESNVAVDAHLYGALSILLVMAWPLARLIRRDIKSLL